MLPTEVSTVLAPLSESVTTASENLATLCTPPPILISPRTPKAVLLDLL
ncbi:MAG: hypothetical protein ACOCP8_03520 [archaeon]